MASSPGTVIGSSRVTEVHDPKASVPHAASLRQAFAHCGRFSTAASRRSLGSVSVPVWVTILSDHLPVAALVGRHPANKLMGREAFPGREDFRPGAMRLRSPSGIRRRFQRLSRTRGRVPHVLRTLSPLRGRSRGVRLACLIHAASVHSEPGSNSPSRKVRPDDSGSTVQIQAADQAAAELSDTGPKPRVPHVALRCSLAKEPEPAETGVPHNMAPGGGIASPKRENS